MYLCEGIQQRTRPRFRTHVLLALMIAGGLRPAVAKDTKKPDFASSEQAAEALYKAVEADDQVTLSKLIGRLTSSGDMIQDKADRQLFVQKYTEMHRLVKEADGTTVLYIGAENWPFPVPLVAKNGNWHFDVDAGEQEIAFRQIGGNEMTAIETCQVITNAKRRHDSNWEDMAINAYAQKVAEDTNSPNDAFHGYYFRLLTTSNGSSVIAYPSEYGSSGVMTFAATSNGRVYEKDLGPNTATMAKSLTTWSPNADWHPLE